MSANVRTITVYDMESWHGIEKELGIAQITAGESPSSAMRRMIRNAQSLYDQEYLRLPAFVEARGGRAGTGVEVMAYTNYGELTILPKMPKRSDPLQPTELAGLMDFLTTEHGWQLQSVVNVGTRGQVLIVEYKMPHFTLENGHEHKPYFVVGQDVLGGGLIYGQTVICVVCENTYNAALPDMVSLGTKDPHVWAALAANVVVVAEQGRQKEIEFLNSLFTKRASLNDFVQAVHPDPKTPHKVALLEKAEALGVDVEDATKSAGKEFAQHQANLARQEQRRTILADMFFEAVDETGTDSAYALWYAATKQVRPSGSDGTFRMDGTVDAYVSVTMGGARSQPINNARAFLEAL